MEIVASTFGSFTITCWNLLSNALSFSICCLYSSSVVAPIMRSSPLANIGLSKLAASMAPSVLPAPRTWWTSSTNKTMCPSAALHSSRTARRRSSNSPRYFAPATNAPMSKVRSATPRRVSGTSPSRIRRANPSTMAVLPTPGSPTKHGLFFVRRHRICMTRLISSSRPMTGSNFPSSASLIRSMPYLSNASYDSSADADVTFRPPRMSSNDFVATFFVSPAPSSSLLTNLSS
mmetsp:Transcript_39481/g.80533  ORF Transcript_39481/g.80533 Transcript_39481/m.80533 type:complete len:233 (-) Transcript_39481:524-1222(-)